MDRKQRRRRRQQQQQQQNVFFFFVFTLLLHHGNHHDPGHGMMQEQTDTGAYVMYSSSRTIVSPFVQRFSSFSVPLSLHKNRDTHVSAHSYQLLSFDQHMSERSQERSREKEEKGKEERNVPSAQQTHTQTHTHAYIHKSCRHNGAGNNGLKIISVSAANGKKTG